MGSDSAAVSLNQTEIDLLVAVVDQLESVNTKKLADKLGCTANAAGKRWRRLKEKIFGENKAGDEADDNAEGEGESSAVKTPKSAGKKAVGKSQFLFHCKRLAQSHPSTHY
jgi:hypothetical protein